MRKPAIYRFPKAGRTDEMPIGRRISMVEEELLEAQRAFWREDDDDVVEALWLVVQAAESALQGFPTTTVMKGLARAKVRSMRRRDYDKGR